MLAEIRKHPARIIIGLAVVLLLLGHVVQSAWLEQERYYQLPLLARLENIVYDARLRFTKQDTVHPGIVILEIDEKSLAERERGGEGRWPWSRDRLALLVDKLFEHYKIEVLGFDVLFAERDESSGIRRLEQISQRELKTVPQFQSVWAELKPQLEYDQIFASRIKGRKVVLGYSFSSDEEDPALAPKKGLLPPPLFTSNVFGANPIRSTSWTGYAANLEVLQESAASAGHINPIVDEDGVIRRVPMLAEYNGAYYEPLSLAVVRVYLNSPPVEPYMGEATYAPDSYRRLEALKLGTHWIPVDATASALVPYRGRRGSFKYIPVVDVLNERIGTAELEGKIVLVGATAPALFDLRSAPVDSVYPGVEIHANLIAGILDGYIKQQPPYVLAAELALLLISGLMMALLLPLLSPLISTVTTLGVLFAVVGINVAAYLYGTVLPLASALVMIFLLFTLNMAYGYFVEARGKRQITGLFGQYVPPELVDEMARDPEQFNMEPREQELTVLFSDVRGFTTISESLTPKDLSAYINEYLTAMSLVIRERHRGTLDKYVGDAIVAFWGAPVGDPQHARNAVLAALDMQEEAKALNEKFKSRGWPTFRIGIGVNSGVMRVGDMGSKIRKAYTVMGDAVNLASRLEDITRKYGADIIIGEGTRRLISGFAVREIDRVRVKGKEESVAIYEPLGLEGQVDPSRRDEVKLWNQALRLYRSQDWDRAELQLLNLRKIAPDRELYESFIERIAHHRARPPGAGWDGTWTFETK